MDADNPLLHIDPSIPFDRIKADHIEPAIEALIARAKTAIAAVVAAPGPRTYANTLGALEDATEPLEFAITIVGHLESVISSDPLRAAYNAVQPAVAQFYAEFDGHPADPAVANAFEELQFFCSKMKQIGTYPKAEYREAR